MKIDKYEIDMLAVGQADALLIHFHDSDKDKWHIVLVDAGHKTDAAKVKDFIAEQYDGAKTIDLAICTHLDSDHIGGFVSLFDDIVNHKEDALQIKEFWINNTYDLKWKDEVKDLVKNVKKIVSEPNLYGNVMVKRAYSTNPKNMNYIATSAFDGIITVLGPSEDYFNELFPIQEGAEVTSFSAKDADEEDHSKINKSSVIFLFQPRDGQKFLFTGDATPESFDKLKTKGLYNKIKNCYWLKVPHHGSEKNMNDQLVLDIHPQEAWITNDENGDCFSETLIYDLQQNGANVCIANTSKQLPYGTETHDGYSSNDVYYPKVDAPRRIGKTYTLQRVTK